MMTATLSKFPQGAWFPFVVAVIMTTFMSFWRWGVSKRRAYEMDKRVRLRELFRREGEAFADKGAEGAFVLGQVELPEKVDTSLTSVPSDQMPSGSPRSSVDSMAISPSKLSHPSDSTLRRRQMFLRATGTPIARLPGISVYYTNAPVSHSYAPCTFTHFLEHFPALHQTCVFLHVRTAAQPHVPSTEKLILERSPLWEGVWRGVYKVGYMETPDFTTAEFTLELFRQLDRPVESLTHVLQYTALKAQRKIYGKGIWAWIKAAPWRVRGWTIDVIWSGIDDVIGGIGKGWTIPVGDVVSVGAVAEV